jgi:hypothetical protein
MQGGNENLTSSIGIQKTSRIIKNPGSHISRVILKPTSAEFSYDILPSTCLITMTTLPWISTMDGSSI